VHIAEEMDDTLGAGQQRQISLDDDTVETMVDKSQQAAEQLAKSFHRSAPGALLANKIIGQRTDGNPEWIRGEGLPRTEGMAEGA
jgi:hypothetical protein